MEVMGSDPIFSSSFLLAIRAGKSTRPVDYRDATGYNQNRHNAIKEFNYASLFENHSFFWFDSFAIGSLRGRFGIRVR
jgi:hypothetical protein